MNKKTNKLRRFLVSLMLMCLTLWGKSIEANADDKEAVAESIYRLKATVTFESGEKEVIGLHSTGEASYLFVPSGAKEWSIDNIDIGDKVFTDDGTLSFYNASTDTIEERPFVVMESANIGSIFLDTKGLGRTTLDSVRKEKYDADIKIINSKGYLDADDNLKFIRTRGNGTFHDTAKKAYEFKFEKKTSVLGMPKAKRWVLLANFFDNSLIRNSLVYDFAKKYTNLYSPNGRYVDVYIDGEYRGNYYLCEKVEINDHRIEIVKQKNEETAPTDITGGYLVCLMPENLIEDDTVYFKTMSGVIYEIKSPENPTEEQVEYITNLFNELEEAVASEDGYSPLTGRHYSEILDVNSYCDKYLIEQLFMNSDLNYNSQYYYKNADSIDSHIFAGPVWDYDMAISDVCQPQQFEDYYLSNNILRFDEVKRMLQRKYEYVYKPYVLEDLEDDLNYKGDLISASYLMNREKYIDECNIYSYGYASYEANSEYILERLRERIGYMDEFLYGEVSAATIDYGTTKEKVTRGTRLGRITAKVHNWFQIFNGWINKNTGDKLSADTVINEDIKAEPDYIDLTYLMTTSVEDIEANNVDLTDVDTAELEKIEAVLERMKGDD